MGALGWIIPPPRRPRKTREQLRGERSERVRRLMEGGLLNSRALIEAMMRVPREKFIPEEYRDYAYFEVPLPIPGRNSTISCPHSYPLFYETLGLDGGDSFLEVGAGSGYGAALAYEVVGASGRVVTIEIDEETYRFARRNLKRLGYTQIHVILGDGSKGYQPLAPYDKIAVTASCPSIPEPLIQQLKPGGRLIAPVGSPDYPQDLILVEKGFNGSIRSKKIDEVLYIPLTGEYGWRTRTHWV
jgi:protein-L-isoaspartate(D-aspartate) O-methyltransferase